MINPKYSAALLSAFRVQQTLVQCATHGSARMSHVNAQVTLDQLRADVAHITALLDDVERRLATDGSDVAWSAQ